MKIICIGRNYVDHAKELNNPVPEEPVFFMKPDTALLRNNAPFFYPSFSKDIQHEVELIIKINKVGRCIGEKFANRYYSEVGLGIDFTARDVQQRCKEKGLPWEVAKAFDFSAPISSKFLPISDFESVDRIPFRLVKNGEVVQQEILVICSLASTALSRTCRSMSPLRLATLFIRERLPVLAPLPSAIVCKATLPIR